MRPRAGRPDDTTGKEQGTRTPATTVHCPLFATLPLCYNAERWNSPMPERTVSLDKSGPVARLTLRRPPAANAVDSAPLAALARACDAIESDDSVRAVVLAADGADFCRGWDESLLAGEDGPPADAFGCPAELPPPVVWPGPGEAPSAGLGRGPG